MFFKPQNNVRINLKLHMRNLNYCIANKHNTVIILEIYSMYHVTILCHHCEILTKC